jgi:hypothetical protein
MMHSPSIQGCEETLKVNGFDFLQHDDAIRTFGISLKELASLVRLLLEEVSVNPKYLISGLYLSVQIMLFRSIEHQPKNV